ncbi:MAG: hypothetical protein OHK0021_08690 [Bryobacter sp.]
MGVADFRVGGRIFATLAHGEPGLGNLMLDPEEQAGLCEEMPEVFRPVAGGWGRMGATHIVLKAANKATLEAALGLAYRRRVAKNEKAAKGKKAASKRGRNLDLDQGPTP